MDNNRNPYIRVPLAIALIAMLFFLPTREFLKATFVLGMPFIFVMGFMVKRPRYSWAWNLGAVLLLAILAIYINTLIHLPERIQIHQIVANGAGLVAEGRFDEAIAEYEKLDDLGQPERMAKEIQEAQKEKQAYQQLEEAKQLINSGKNEEARQVLEAIPIETRAAQEARKLFRDL